MFAFASASAGLLVIGLITTTVALLVAAVAGIVADYRAERPNDRIAPITDDALHAMIDAETERNSPHQKP